MNAYRQPKVLRAMLFVWLSASAAVHAADNFIQGSTWADPDNWSLHSPPANGDHAFITGSSAGDLTVLFDYNYTPPGLGGFTVDNTGGGKMVLSVPENSLFAANAVVGKAGSATLAQTGGTVSLSSSLTLAEGSGSSGRYELSAGSLSVAAYQNAVVGYGGTGTLVQTGGDASFGNIGIGGGAGSSGRYDLSAGTSTSNRLYVGGAAGGTLNVSGTGHLHIGYAMAIGQFGGQSTVNQTGGLVSGGSTEIGDEFSSAYFGTYNLSGGSHNTTSLTIENGLYTLSGTGQFTTNHVKLDSWGATVGRFHQSGGTATIAGTLTLGSESSNPAPAYTLADGTLTAATVRVGSGTVGRLFQQTGGSATITNLIVGAAGSYEYSGGALTVVNTTDLAGKLDFSNSTVTMTARSGSTLNFAAGQILNSGNATLTVEGTDSFVMFAGGFVPESRFASFSNQGTTHFTGSTLIVDAGKTVRLVGSLGDHAVVAGTLTNQGQAVNLHSGVEVSGTGVVDLGDGALTVQDTLSNISGGQLTGATMSIGKNGTGVFRQTGGTVDLGSLTLAEGSGSSGRYELSAGSLSVAAYQNAVVGMGGTGTLVQTGGDASFGNIGIGGGAGSSGRYDLSAGTSTISNLYVGGEDSGAASTLNVSGTGQLHIGHALRLGQFGGQSTLNQTGGSVSGGGTEIGDEWSSAYFGTYHLSGGSHSTTSLTIENGLYNLSGTGQLMTQQVDLDSRGATAGRFQQSGGTATIAGTLTLGSESSSVPAAYALTDGALTAATVRVGSTTVGSLFQQTGGSATITNLIVGAAGRHEMSGGSLSATDLTNDGQFTCSGGGLTASTFINTGTTTLSGTGTRAIAGNVTNAGTVAVHTAVIFDGVFTNTGTLDTDGVALTFHNLLFGSSGYVRSDTGAMYSVSGDFINHSATANLWDSTGADLYLVGSGTHLLALAGADLGTNGYSDNYAWRSLVLDPGGSLVLEDGNSTPGAALYVSRFILSDGLDQIARVHGYGSDIYYDSLLPDNFYLDGQTYDLADGGQLIPTAIPEPAIIWNLLALLGGAVALRGRRREWCRAPRAFTSALNGISVKD